MYNARVCVQDNLVSISNNHNGRRPERVLLRQVQIPAARCVGREDGNFPGPADAVGKVSVLSGACFQNGSSSLIRRLGPSERTRQSVGTC